ncbi:ExbD/TolR family protein [Sulfitobacter sabulilitoris]|uniref:Biopolymer transporter ExbD n=1 Tax=Sulfitobacter sabulilitoris TaxID=2562655 RepID=A0A5S3QAI6_9RHOB|nr:biopolymer transporter ExbD [Sulfitobacter sabulilitoris]TMM54122.1 biopolymer transporter ExbD [Sulfitobacter sabulilitoris]
MRLRRQTPPPRLISLVSMVDVLLIMLVFFMVTSTYLDLDMIPMIDTAEDGVATPAKPASGPVLMIRLGADGTPHVSGQAMSYDMLSSTLATLSTDVSVMILPSLRADTQSLVSLMDVATAAGVRRLRVVQVAAP